MGQFTYVGSPANETSSMHRNAAGGRGRCSYVVVLKVCHVPRDRRRRPGAQDGLPSRQAALQHLQMTSKLVEGNFGQVLSKGREDA